jgi:hypothetical protein
MLNANRVRAFSRRSLYALPLLAANSLLTDGAAISLSVAVGAPWNTLLHWMVLAPWACLLLWALHHRILPDAMATWAERQESRLDRRLQSLLRWGKPSAVLLLAASVGPLSALIGIRVFGFAAPRRYLLAAQAAAVYCMVWTGLIYGGGWVLLQHILVQLQP